MNESMAAALMKSLGKASRTPAVSVDMERQLESKGLDKLFPPALWPPIAAVRELATKAKSMQKAGQPNACVWCECTVCEILCHKEAPSEMPKFTDVCNE